MVRNLPQAFVPLSADEDRQLTLALRTGDATAFEAIFRVYAEPLLGFAYSHVRSREGAEEIVQDLFTRLWTNRHAFDPANGLRAYLFGAVRNRALNALRDDATTRRLAQQLTHVPGASPGATPAADAAAIAADLESALQDAVADMPTRCREVFLLVRTRSLSYAEVAGILGIANKTVEVHMSRALAILRVRLGSWLQDRDQPT